jgi:hypothetical protein
MPGYVIGGLAGLSVDSFSPPAQRGQHFRSQVRPLKAGVLKMGTVRELVALPVMAAGYGSGLVRVLGMDQEETGCSGNYYRSLEVTALLPENGRIH